MKISAVSLNLALLASGFGAFTQRLAMTFQEQVSALPGFYVGWNLLLDDLLRLTVIHCIGLALAAELDEDLAGFPDGSSEGR